MEVSLLLSPLRPGLLQQLEGFSGQDADHQGRSSSDPGPICIEINHGGTARKVDSMTGFGLKGQVFKQTFQLVTRGLYKLSFPRMIATEQNAQSFLFLRKGTLIHANM